MAETFYPFVEGDSPDDDITPPTTSARIAVYDDMAMVPRVVAIEPTDIRSYLEEITKTVFELATQQGGDWSFMLIRELVENFIHASFIEPSISILEKGRTLVFSDQGPGIPNKQAALKPSFSSATKSMKRYIRGVGSGLPIVEEQLRLKNGSITIEDNLGHGTIVTVSLAPSQANPPASQTPLPPQQAAGASIPAGQGTADPSLHAPGAYGAAPQQPGGATAAPPAPYGYGAPAGAPLPYGSQQTYGAPNPYGTSYANPYGAPQQPANPAYQPGYPYGTVPQQPYGAATAGYASSGAYAPGAYGAAPQQPGGATAAPQAPYGYGAPAGAPLPYGSQQTYGSPQAYGSPQPYGGPSAFPGAAPASGPMAVAPAGFDPAAPIPGQTAIDAHAPLTTQQRQIVRLFARYRELGPTELSSELGFSESTGTRRLKDIMAAGYVTKNGQKYILTGEGERMLAYLMDSEV